MQRRTVVGSRSSLLWLLILIGVVLIGAIVVVVIIVVPQLQASRTEQARLVEVERHYQAGVAFQGVDDWASAEGEYKQVITLNAGYKDVTVRLAEVRGTLSAIQATATTFAVAQEAQATTEAISTVAAAPTAAATALEAHYQKGLGFMNLNRWEEAKAEMEQVFATNPNHKDVQAKLLEIMAQLASPTSTITPSVTPSPKAKVATPVPVPTRTIQPTPTPKQVVHHTLNANDSAGLHVNVSAGDRLTVIVAGKVHTRPGGTVADCDYWTGPNGIASCHYVRGVSDLHGLPFMALIAKVDGEWVFVGERSLITITRGSDVWFMINDWDFTDSQGSFTIEIDVE